jgi:ubiquinone/menaquinone biosynthesis C-methylase UbiE
MTARVTPIVAAFDQAADRYDTLGAQLAGPVAARLVALAGLKPGWRVLDAGCGAGAVLFRADAAASPGGHVAGVDLAPAMLARVRRHADASPAVTVQQADAADPPFAHGSFDAVLSSLVLYLLPDPVAALARWRDLLVPGGVVAFNFAAGRRDPRWMEVFAAIEAHLPSQAGFFAYTSRLPDPGQMQSLLTHHGYTGITTIKEPITVRYDNPAHWWAVSVTEGPWVSWQHIPPGRLSTARADALRLLEELREPDGSLSRTIPMVYVTARSGPARPNRPAATP